MTRRPVVRTLATAVAAALLSAAAVIGIAAPAHAADPTAASLLARLPVAAKGAPAASALDAFPHWTAADGSCRTPDVQVLTARSRSTAKPGGCTVRSGRWTSAFTGATLTSTSKATVVWTVPLQEAWRSGGSGWSALRRQAFANDVADGRSLLVVDIASAKRRGDRDPASWMPVSKERCAYTKDWIAVKARWGLSVTTKERSALAADLKRYCRTSPRTAAPATPDVAALTGTAAPAPPAAPTAAPSSTAPASTAPTSTAPTSTAPVEPAPTASPTSSPTTSPTPRPKPACSPSGTVGDDLRTRVAAVPSGGLLRLPGSQLDFADFAQAPVGVDVPAGVTGIAGDGAGGTVIEMAPCTSTHAADVPTAANTTNQLSLLRIGGSPALSDFTLQGTTQGHLYNGLRLQRTTGATVDRVAVRSIPGNADVNPGETFGINDFVAQSTDYRHVIVDGTGIGASGLGLNSSTGTSVEDSVFMNNAHSAGIAVWQSNGLTVSDTTLSSNATGLNLERASGAIDLTDVTFSGNTVCDVRLASDAPTTATLTISDPVITAKDGKLRIRVQSTYRGVANTQLQSDVHVIVHGEDVTDRLVTWLP